MIGLPARFAVAGTDTGIGKTLVSALLCSALDLTYWKPVQAGTDEATDTEVVRALSATAGARVRTLPEGAVLAMPASPHAAAEAEGRALRLADLTLPTAAETPRLCVELAGGLLVPWSLGPPVLWQHELVQAMELGVVVVARTGLGTLNHTTLTVRACAALSIRCLGVILVGPEHPRNQADLPTLTDTPVLGRIPWVGDPFASFASLRAGLLESLVQQAAP